MHAPLLDTSKTHQIRCQLIYQLSYLVTKYHRLSCHSCTRIRYWHRRITVPMVSQPCHRTVNVTLSITFFYVCMCRTLFVRRFRAFKDDSSVTILLGLCIYGFMCGVCLVITKTRLFKNMWKISPPKPENFQIKNPDIFHITAQNIYR